jgi:flagellar basal body rod protein FlgG
MREIKKLGHDDLITEKTTKRLAHISKLIVALEEALELGTESKRDKILQKSNDMFIKITNKPQIYGGIDFESADSYAFVIKTKDGKIGYSRAGIFSVDSGGNLVNNEGNLVEPPIKIPNNASEISVRSDGTIRGVLPQDKEEGQDSKLPEVVDFGQIALFKFDNPEGLESIGHNIYFPTAASGKAIAGISGVDGYGEIKSGMIERSNTDIVNAMTKLIEAQRAYQFDLRISKDQDEMMQQAIMMRG